METDEAKENTDSSKMTRETFLLNELVHWIVFFKEMGRRNFLIEHDAVVTCGENETATLFDADEILKGEVNLGVPFLHNNLTVTIHQHLTPEHLRLDEFIKTEDYYLRGFYHHKMLREILNAVEESFNPFVKIIYGYRKDKLPVTEKPSQTAYLLIKDVLDFIETNTVKNAFSVIPDLFTFHSDISLMSFDEKFIYSLLEGDRDGKKYVYMFSRKTSESFGIVLKEILNKKLTDQREIAQFNGDKDATLEKPDFILPKETKLRLKKLAEYYGLDQIRRQNRLTLSNGQAMYLMRLLQDHKVLLGIDVLSKEQLVLAVSILTGISPNILYNQYPYDKEVNLLKVMNRYSPEGAEGDAQKLRNKMKELFIGIANKKL